MLQAALADIPGIHGVSGSMQIGKPETEARRQLLWTDPILKSQGKLAFGVLLSTLVTWLVPICYVGLHDLKKVRREGDQCPAYLYRTDPLCTRSIKFPVPYPALTAQTLL